MMVNEKKVDYFENMKISDLISMIKCDSRFVGYDKFRLLMMINGEIVTRNNQNTIVLNETDEIKIIPLLAGG